LAITGYGPEQWVVQPGTRGIEHRGRNVRTDDEPRRANERERRKWGFARSSRDIEHSASWCELDSAKH
jgi:hypothetical protein